MVVIAIDGPSGSGKSSASRAVAAFFHWEYLDTGALYRALTLFAIERDVQDFSRIPELLTSDSIMWKGSPEEPQLLLEGRGVNSEIRSERVTKRVSEVAADPEVRKFLLTLQRAIINQARSGIVVEGRDIGTTVWPDAELKIFLTADLIARAERRNAELSSNFTNEEIQDALAARDVVDSNRSTSPLRQIDEQIIIDATHLSLKEVVREIKRLVIELELNDEGEPRE
ncbi:MAG: (d)CMP kinase [Actinomycetota bacterium]